MTFPDPMLTKAEVAELLRCCERTIERQVRDGAFPPPHKFGKESLWFQSVICAWLEKRREAQMRWVEGATASAVAGVSAAPGDAPTQSAQAAQAASANATEPASRTSRAKPRPAGVQSIFSAQQLSHMRR